MSLKYTCPGCGTPLGYDGLCWKCKCEQERKTALAWTPEQIAEKQRNLIQNIHRLADMEDPECTDFWQLLGYRDAITPEIQRAALAAGVFWPCEIYYHAPACWSWSEIPGPGVRASMWTHPAMHRLAAGPLTRRDNESNSTSIPAFPSSREPPVKCPPFASGGHGRTPVPTAAGGWRTCWCWTAGASG